MNNDFITLVARMRSAQKRYFKERSTDALNESKTLERQVDSEIQQRQSTQGTLL